MLEVFLKWYLCRLRNFFVSLIFLRLWQPFFIRCIWPIENMLRTKYREHVHSINYIVRRINSTETGKCLRCKWHTAVQYIISRTDALWKILPNKLLFPSQCIMSVGSIISQYDYIRLCIKLQTEMSIADFLSPSYN